MHDPLIPSKDKWHTNASKKVVIEIHHDTEKQSDYDSNSQKNKYEYNIEDDESLIYITNKNLNIDFPFSFRLLLILDPISCILWIWLVSLWNCYDLEPRRLRDSIISSYISAITIIIHIFAFIIFMVYYQNKYYQTYFILIHFMMFIYSILIYIYAIFTRHKINRFMQRYSNLPQKTKTIRIGYDKHDQYVEEYKISVPLMIMSHDIKFVISNQRQLSRDIYGNFRIYANPATYDFSGNRVDEGYTLQIGPHQICTHSNRVYLVKMRDNLAFKWQNVEYKIQQMLICAYVRNINNKTNLFLPMDIKHIILRYHYY